MDGLKLYGESGKELDSFNLRQFVFFWQGHKNGVRNTKVCYVSNEQR